MSTLAGCDSTGHADVTAAAFVGILRELGGQLLKLRWILGELGADPLGGRDAVENGHLDVHDAQVRSQVARHGDGQTDR